MSTNKLDYDIINKRKEEYKLFEKLTPPLVILNMEDGNLEDGDILVAAFTDFL